MLLSWRFRDWCRPFSLEFRTRNLFIGIGEFIECDPLHQTVASARCWTTIRNGSGRQSPPEIFQPTSDHCQFDLPAAASPTAANGGRRRFLDGVVPTALFPVELCPDERQMEPLSTIPSLPGWATPMVQREAQTVILISERRLLSSHLFRK
jgi:hypothetical protein